MENLAGAKIDKKALISNLQAWLAANPIVHSPLALITTWLFTCISLVCLYCSTLISSKSIIFKVFMLATLSGTSLILIWMLLVIIQLVRYEFKVSVLQKKTDFDDVRHHYYNRDETDKSTAARSLKHRVHRNFEIITGNGGGVSPTEIPVPPAEVIATPQYVNEEVRIESGIEIIQHDTDFNYTVPNEVGKVSWKQIAKWYSEAHIAYKKNSTNTTKERYNQRRILYLEARYLKNEEIKRRYVENLALNIYEEKVNLFFKGVPTDIDSSICKPYCITGNLTRAMQYMRAYVSAIEGKKPEFPVPSAYDVTFNEAAWETPLKNTATTAGCIYKITRATATDEQSN